MDFQTEILVCIRIISADLVNQESIPCDFRTAVKSALIIHDMSHTLYTYSTKGPHLGPEVLTQTPVLRYPQNNGSSNRTKRNNLSDKISKRSWTEALNGLPYTWSTALCAPGSSQGFLYVNWMIKVSGIFVILIYQDHWCVLREMSSFSRSCNVCS